ncbi:ArgK/MeaB family GTPase [Mesorhizobium sp. A623]
MISSAERRQLGRILSAVQNDSDGEGGVAAPFYGETDAKTTIVALTGPPGAGKSTLLDRMAVHWADRGERVAALAIDPSSPFSGGAMLGDRIRANAATSHAGVYMRSMSARNSLDRLITSVVDSCAVFAHFGFTRILLETVGAGQMSLEALDLADCIVGVSVPGLGDAVQLSKAGLLEIADIHVVNKSDLDGADRLRAGLEAMLEIAYPAPGHPFNNARRAQPGVQALFARHGDPERENNWHPLVLAVSATDRAGIDCLCAASEEFLDWETATGRLQRRRHARLRNALSIRIKDRILRSFELRGGAMLDQAAIDIASGRLDMRTAVRTLAAQPHSVKALGPEEIAP